MKILVKFVFGVLAILGGSLVMSGGMGLFLSLSKGESMPHPFVSASVSASMLIAGIFILLLYFKRQRKQKEVAMPEKEAFLLAKSGTDEALIKLARMAAEAVRTKDVNTFNTIRSALKKHVDIRRFADVIRTHLSIAEQKAILDAVQRHETNKGE